MALRLMERMYITTDVKPGPSEASKTLVIVVRKACNFPNWNSCPIYFPLQSVLRPVHRLLSSLWRNFHWLPFAHQAGIHFVPFSLVHHSSLCSDLLLAVGV